MSLGVSFSSSAQSRVRLHSRTTQDCIRFQTRLISPQGSRTCLCYHSGVSLCSHWRSNADFSQGATHTHNRKTCLWDALDKTSNSNHLHSSDQECCVCCLQNQTAVSYCQLLSMVRAQISKNCKARSHWCFLLWFFPKRNPFACHFTLFLCGRQQVWNGLSCVVVVHCFFSSCLNNCLQ